MRPAGELIGIDDGEPDDPVDHVPEPRIGRQRPREYLDQGPGRQDPDDVPDDQHRRRFEQRRPTHLGPEFPICQHEKKRGRDMHCEPESLAEVLRGRVVARGDIGHHIERAAMLAGRLFGLDLLIVDRPQGRPGVAAVPDQPGQFWAQPADGGLPIWPFVAVTTSAPCCLNSRCITSRFTELSSTASSFRPDRSAPGDKTC